MSGAAIQDYLAKMRRRGPVLKDVLEVVPADLDSVRALLEYRRWGTDLEAVLALAQGGQEEQGEFVLCDPQHVLEECGMEEERREREGAGRLQLLARLDCGSSCSTTSTTSTPKRKLWAAASGLRSDSSLQCTQL